LRRAHRHNRSAPRTGRARTASPARKRRKSSANSRAVAYLRDGSLCKHFRQMVSRSRGTWWLTLRGGRGSSCSTW
jgi:hypothetical protein